MDLGYALVMMSQAYVKMSVVNNLADNVTFILITTISAFSLCRVAKRLSK